LFVVGGVNSTEILTSTLAYDAISKKGTEKIPIPTARYHLTSAVVNGKLYVIGGRSNDMSFNVDANEVYDPASNKWTLQDPMPSKKGGLASAVGNVYMLLL
jgi:hypothetical protein